MAELAAKTHEINTLEQQLHHMAQTYLPARPDQTRQLNALAFIVNQFKQVQTPTPLDLRAQTLSFEVHTSLNPIHLLVDYPELALTSTRLDEAHWRIELEL